MSQTRAAYTPAAPRGMPRASPIAYGRIVTPDPQKPPILRGLASPGTEPTRKLGRSLTRLRPSLDRHRLGQVPRLVRVPAQPDRKGSGQVLQREDALQRTPRLLDGSQNGEQCVLRRPDADDARAPGLHLGDVAGELA